MTEPGHTVSVPGAGVRPGSGAHYGKPLPVVTGAGKDGGRLASGPGHLVREMAPHTTAEQAG
ncbi:MAG: hypothetical protein J2P31_02145, partial [Blastocatellia bacterium]|nr:hypothetical protein [Blastocatellia bacterium]